MIQAGTGGISKPPENQGLQLPGMGGEDKNYWTTIPRNHPRYPILIHKCLGECDFDSDSVMNQTFFIAWIFCHGAELYDKDTGEVFNMPRCVAINPDGKTLKFVSVGVYSDLQWFVRTFGPVAWNPPVPAIVKRQPTRNGFKIIRLEIDESKPLPPVYDWNSKK